MVETPYRASEIAEYFLAKIDEETYEIISNLKLQKLVYYAQGFCLTTYNKPLFLDDIEAWAHGPVIPDLYHFYKDYGAGGIPSPINFNSDMFDEETRELLDEVYGVYAQYSAWKLRNMTHEEPPWLEKYETGGVITHESMNKYFKTLLCNN